VGAPALARPGRHSAQGGEPDPRAQVRARRDHDSGGREEQARVDGGRRGVGRLDRLLLPGAGGRERLRAADGEGDGGRAEYRRPPSLRRVRVHRAVQLPARALHRHVRRGARDGQRGPVQTGGGRALDGAQVVRGVPRRRASRRGVQLYPGCGRGHGGGAVASPGHRRRRVHGLEGRRNAHLPGPLPGMDQAVPARDGREERCDRHGFGRPRCCGGGGDALRLRAAEPEVQRHLARVRAAAGGERFTRAVALARQEGTVLLGGDRLRGGVFDRGHFVAPTIARLPLSSALFTEELFVPLLVVGEVAGLEQAIVEANKAEYGLTAGIFSKKAEEVERFFDEIEAGVCYVNKRTGATTGAWPGAQPFTGWKGSGSTGKGGCGPYYVVQFLREQSRTVIEESR